MTEAQSNNLLTISHFFKSINLWIGKTLSWLTFATVLLMFFNVVQRYFFATNHIWQAELVSAVHAFLFLIVAGYTLHDNQHIRVDVLYGKFSKRQKAWVNLMGSIFLLAPTAFLISYFSYDFISNSWQIHEASREADGLPGVYLVKSFIFLFSATLLSQSFATICDCLHTLLHKK